MLMIRASRTVLDEPTTGLHMADIDRLLGVLDRLVDDYAATVLVNLDVIATPTGSWSLGRRAAAGEAGCCTRASRAAWSTWIAPPPPSTCARPLPTPRGCGMTTAHDTDRRRFAAAVADAAEAVATVLGAHQLRGTEPYPISVVLPVLIEQHRVLQEAVDACAGPLAVDAAGKQDPLVGDLAGFMSYLQADAPARSGRFRRGSG
jgi:hypothetical protein